jgi:hypothetical protein
VSLQDSLSNPIFSSQLCHFSPISAFHSRIAIHLPALGPIEPSFAFAIAFAPYFLLLHSSPSLLQLSRPHRYVALLDFVKKQ